MYIDLLVLLDCLKTILWRIKFSSPSLLLCARSQAVFGGIHPVKISIHTAVRSYESATTGKPLLSSRVLECQTTRPLDNSPQTTRPRSSDSAVDKRTKNNLYEV